MEEMKIENVPEVNQVPEKRKIELREYNTKQLEIARKMYQHMHDDASSASVSNNEVMKFWTDTGYNDNFRKIVLADSFIEDPKFGGEILNITPEDILHFVDPDLRQE